MVISLRGYKELDIRPTKYAGNKVHIKLWENTGTGSNKDNFILTMRISAQIWYIQPELGYTILLLMLIVVLGFTFVMYKSGSDGFAKQKQERDDESNKLRNDRDFAIHH